MENTQIEIETLINSTVQRDDLHLRPLTAVIDLATDESFWTDRNFITDSHLPASGLKKSTDPLTWTGSEYEDHGSLKGCVDGETVRRGENEKSSEVNGVPITEESPVLVRGEDIGDAHTQYNVAGLRKGELPVIGTYVDRRIVPGFMYTVRILGSRRYMFEGRALPLLQIGKGYGKRITFKGDSLNSNQNYFWSDSNPEGCAFSLVAVQRGERFSIYDEQSRPVGSAVIESVEPQQVELCTQISPDGAIKKRVRVTIACEVHFGGQPHGLMPVCSESVIQTSGVAVLVKGKRHKEAELEAIEYIDLPFHGQCVFYKEE